IEIRQEFFPVLLKILTRHGAAAKAIADCGAKPKFMARLLPGDLGPRFRFADQLTCSVSGDIVLDPRVLRPGIAHGKQCEEEEEGHFWNSHIQVFHFYRHTLSLTTETSER